MKCLFYQNSDPWLFVKDPCRIRENRLDSSHHEGGYSCFRTKLKEMKDSNQLEIHVDNSHHDAVYPQKADFTYSGKGKTELLEIGFENS